MERSWSESPPGEPQLPGPAGPRSKWRGGDNALLVLGERGASSSRTQPLLDLIFCAGDSREFFHIAQEAGYLLGIRSDRGSSGYAIHFVDIAYKRRNTASHLKTVSRYQPKYATVLDLSEEEVAEQDIERAMKQYEQLANYSQVPLIVPKLPGQIALLPKYVAIGYSIPTRYGGAQYTLAELQDRRVHLLGGSPHQQMNVYRQLGERAKVMSVDGNMAMKVARNFAGYWDGKWVAHPEKGSHTPLYLDCWKRSCEHIRRAWENIAVLQPRPSHPGETVHVLNFPA